MRDQKYDRHIMYFVFLVSRTVVLFSSSISTFDACAEWGRVQRGRGSPDAISTAKNESNQIKLIGRVVLVGFIVEIAID